jgi:hypothetical protein
MASKLEAFLAHAGCNGMDALQGNRYPIESLTIVKPDLNLSTTRKIPLKILFLHTKRRPEGTPGMKPINYSCCSC